MHKKWKMSVIERSCLNMKVKSVRPVFCVTSEEIATGWFHGGMEWRQRI